MFEIKGLLLINLSCASGTWNKNMCHSMHGCGKEGGCIPALIGKILLIVGGINWGLVGVGTLMRRDWNVIHALLETIPTVEAIIYILVGVAAIINIFGCRCKKCMASCISCASCDSCSSCGTDTKAGGTV